MKKTYINQIPLAHGELTVIVSDHAEKVMRHSCKLAKSVKEAGVSALLINCGMSDARFREHSGYPEEANPAAHLVIKSSIRGDLIGERVEIDQIISECNIRVLIIAGWEWAASGFRRKERLLFYLREIMKEYGIAVICYTQRAAKPVAGKYDRGGIGKLSMLAIAIFRDDISDTLEKAVPKPPPLVIHSDDEMLEAERSAQLLAREINNFQSEVASPRSEVGEEKGVISTVGEIYNKINPNSEGKGRKKVLFL